MKRKLLQPPVGYYVVECVGFYRLATAAKPLGGEVYTTAKEAYTQAFIRNIAEPSK